MTKYPKLKDGEGMEVEPGEVIRFACCDCGLVHRIGFAIEENGSIGFALEREPRGTAQLRRHGFGFLQQGLINGWKMIRSGANYQ